MSKAENNELALKKVKHAAKPAAKPAEDWTKPKWMKLSDLVLDEYFQSRQDIPNPADYAELIEGANQGVWPFSEPIRVASIKGKNFVVAGFTRCAAARQVGGDECLVYVSSVTMTREKAFEFSLGENTSHGFRRTNADKAKAVRLAIAKWPSKSAIQIAKICRVSNTYVANILKKLKDADTVSEEELSEQAVTEQAAPKTEPPAATNVPAENADVDFEFPEYVETNVEAPAKKPASTGATMPPNAVNLSDDDRAAARKAIGILVRVLERLGKAESCRTSIEYILSEVE